jgi:hypothetical protein
MVGCVDVCERLRAQRGRVLDRKRVGRRKERARHHDRSQHERSCAENGQDLRHPVMRVGHRLVGSWARAPRQQRVAIAHCVHLGVASVVHGQQRLPLASVAAHGDGWIVRCEQTTEARRRRRFAGLPGIGMRCLGWITPTCSPTLRLPAVRADLIPMTGAPTLAKPLASHPRFKVSRPCARGTPCTHASSL